MDNSPKFEIIIPSNPLSNVTSKITSPRNSVPISPQTGLKSPASPARSKIKSPREIRLEKQKEKQQATRSNNLNFQNKKITFTPAINENSDEKFTKIMNFGQEMDKKMHIMSNDIFKIKKIEKTKNNIEKY